MVGGKGRFFFPPKLGKVLRELGEARLEANTVSLHLLSVLVA